MYTEAQFYTRERSPKFEYEILVSLGYSNFECIHLYRTSVYLSIFFDSIVNPLKIFKLASESCICRAVLRSSIFSCSFCNYIFLNFLVTISRSGVESTTLCNFCSTLVKGYIFTEYIFFPEIRDVNTRVNN